MSRFLSQPSLLKQCRGARLKHRYGRPALDARVAVR